MGVMDREKVIKDLKEYRDRDCIREGITYFDDDPRYRKMIINNAIAMLKEKEARKFLVDENGKITPLPVVVRCKDCVFGKREKNDSTGMTWIYCGHHRENRPEDWFCADGEKWNE